MLKRPKTIPTIFDQRYFNSLDGFRALSIMMVILFHLLMSFKLPVDLHPFATLGVQFFFVISGFLITTLLLKEKLKKGSINLKNFYVRRAIRILPVAYVYLTAVVIVNLVLNLKLDYFLIFASFIFIRNFFIYAEGVNHLTTHYWSLSVEEQFYLVFPILLKKNFLLYILFLFFIIILSVTQVYIPLTLSKIRWLEVSIQFITQFQSIAVGSLMSILIFNSILDFSIWLKHRGKITVAGLIIIFALIALPKGATQITTLFQSCIFSILLVLNLYEFRRDFFYKLLNTKWLKLVGLLSYSLYIWQQPFTLNLSFLESKNLIDSNNMFQKLGVISASTFLLFTISFVSYFYFEKKLLKLRESFK